MYLTSALKGDIGSMLRINCVYVSGDEKVEGDGS